MKIVKTLNAECRPASQSYTSPSLNVSVSLQLSNGASLAPLMPTVPPHVFRRDRNSAGRLGTAPAHQAERYVPVDRRVRTCPMERKTSARVSARRPWFEPEISTAGSLRLRGFLFLRSAATIHPGMIRAVSTQDRRRRGEKLRAEFTGNCTRARDSLAFQHEFCGMESDCSLSSTQRMFFWASLNQPKDCRQKYFVNSIPDF